MNPPSQLNLSPGHLSNMSCVSFLPLSLKIPLSGCHLHQILNSIFRTKIKWQVSYKSNPSPPIWKTSFLSTHLVYELPVNSLSILTWNIFYQHYLCILSSYCREQ